MVEYNKAERFNDGDTSEVVLVGALGIDKLNLSPL